MDYIIDRIEGDIAVVECDDGYINVSVLDIDGEPKEGDCLVKQGERFIVDEELTKQRRADMIALQNEFN